MLTILSLFGRSPFAPLQSHMDSVSHCVHKLYEVAEAIEMKDYERLDKLTEEISFLEHKADLIKNDIRNHLPKSLILPIDRSSLLDILSIQDRIADKAEDIAVIVSLRPMEFLPVFKDHFKLFLRKNIETFDKARLIIKELHELIESSFGGIEAENVRTVIEDVAFSEHEVDLIQRQLLKSLFKAEDQMSYITFHQWDRLCESVAAISNLSENLANRVRMTLELK
jgi:uncharacterized protein